MPEKWSFRKWKVDASNYYDSVFTVNISMHRCVSHSFCLKPRSKCLGSTNFETRKRRIQTISVGRKKKQKTIAFSRKGKTFSWWETTFSHTSSLQMLPFVLLSLWPDWRGWRGCGGDVTWPQSLSGLTFSQHRSPDSVDPAFFWQMLV